MAAVVFSVVGIYFCPVVKENNTHTQKLITNLDITQDVFNSPCTIEIERIGIHCSFSS